MNVFHSHSRIVEDYATYIRSFLNIADPAIRGVVEGELEKGKLWPEPLLQFNPAFEMAGSVADLSRDGTLHRDIADISKGYSLYRHQVEAIDLGTAGVGRQPLFQYIITTTTRPPDNLTKVPWLRETLRGAPRSDQAGGIDPRIGAKSDAVGIDEKDFAVRDQLAEDGRGVAAGDAVQDRAGVRLLDETREFAAIDGETLPVDDRTGRIGNVQHAGSRAREACLPVHHRGTGRVGLGRTAAEESCDDAGQHGARLIEHIPGPKRRCPSTRTERRDPREV